MKQILIFAAALLISAESYAMRLHSTAHSTNYISDGYAILAYEEEEIQNLILHVQANNLEQVKMSLEKDRPEPSRNFKNRLACEGLCCAARIGNKEMCTMFLQTAVVPTYRYNPLKQICDQETAAVIFTNFLFLPSQAHLNRSRKVVVTLLASLKKMNYFPKDVQKWIVYNTDAFADFMIRKIKKGNAIPEQFLSRVEKRLFEVTVNELSKMREEAMTQSTPRDAKYATQILAPMCAECQYADGIRETIHTRLVNTPFIYNGQEADDHSLEVRDIQDAVRTRLNKCVVQ